MNKSIFNQKIKKMNTINFKSLSISKSSWFWFRPKLVCDQFSTAFFLFIFTLMLIGCGGCGGVKPIISKEKENAENKGISFKEPEKKANEMPPKGVIPPPPPPRMHPDTAAARNKEVYDRVKNYTIQPDADTKYFTIDANNGNVSDCPILHFAGTGKEIWKVDSIKEISNNRLMLTLSAKIKRQWNEIMQNEIAVDEFGLGPTYFSNDGKYFVMAEGYDHGGILTGLCFFDKEGNLLNRY